MNSDSKKWRILIVEDHRILRKTLRMVLEDIPEIVVAGEAETGAEAIKACRTDTFHLVLLDLRLPDISGPEVARILKARDAGIKILGLSVQDDDVFRQQMLDAGADAFASKLDGGESLIKAIQALTSRKI